MTLFHNSGYDKLLQHLYLVMSQQVMKMTIKSWITAIWRKKKNVILVALICFLLILVYRKDLHRTKHKTIKRLPAGHPPRGHPHKKQLPAEDTVAFQPRLVKEETIRVKNKAPLHIPKGLSDLESIYYYDDGAIRNRSKTHKIQVEPADADNNVVEPAKPKQDYEDSQDAMPKQDNNDVAVQQCDHEILNIDDTNVAVNLDPCKFNVISGDASIEHKINNVQPIELPLLRNYRNPCWYEALPTVSQYKNKVNLFWWQVKESFDKVLPVMEERRKKSHMWRLRCIPLVYIIGLAHCGANDLFNILLGHPYILKGATREPFYWDRNRWYHNSNISNYLDLYDEAAETIRKTHVTRTIRGKSVAYHPIVTLDGSVQYMSSFRGIHDLPGNKNKNEPVYFLPHLIRNLTPKTDLQVIVALRNPTDRLFVNYASFDTGKEKNKSAEEFHELAKNHIERISKCYKRYSLRHCLYEPSVIKTTRKVDAHVGIYFGFLKEWKAVFPKLKVILWEEFRLNRVDTYKNIISDLGLYVEPKTLPSKMALETDPNPGFQMMSETRKMLDEFYKPYNNKLADFLKDKKFSFP